MGQLRGKHVTMSNRGGRALVLGGETPSALDAPTAMPGGDPFSRAFETGGGRGGGGYTAIDERTWEAEDTPLSGLHAYYAQPSSPSPYEALREPLERHQDTKITGARTNSRNTPKTRFPSLTPLSRDSPPAPGAFSAAGDTRAAEAVAHARKTWARPALRTQAIASYGAIPDLEIIPEGTEVDRFQKRQGIRQYSDLGCPTCSIS